MWFLQLEKPTWENMFWSKAYFHAVTRSICRALVTVIYLFQPGYLFSLVGNGQCSFPLKSQLKLFVPFPLRNCSHCWLHMVFVVKWNVLQYSGFVRLKESKMHWFSFISKNMGINIHVEREFRQNKMQIYSDYLWAKKLLEPVECIKM